MLTTLAQIWQDIRFACRMLASRPLPMLVALVSLAGSIGATTAVYSTADWLLSRAPGGVIAPDRLVTLRGTDATRPDSGQLSFSLPQYFELRKIQNTFVDIAAYGKVLGVVAAADRPAQEAVYELVTGNYFPLIGVRPALGRTILPEDDVPGAPPVVMLSYRFWQSHFGGDPNVIGAPVLLSGKEGRVIGVAPEAFRGGYNLDWNGPSSVWVPMHAGVGETARLVSGNVPFFLIMGRLKPEIDLELARQQAQPWAAALPPAQSRFKATGILTFPSSEMRVRQERGQAKTFFGMLLIVAVLILAAACFNVASFQLGRLRARTRELALRMALGASRWRVLQQLLTEAALLGLCATALGVLLAVWLTRLLSTSPRLYLNRPLTTESLVDSAPVDLTMVAIGVAVGLGSALVFGVLPALLASFRNPVSTFKETSQQWTWRGLSVTPRQGVLLLQVAMSVVLGITAGLFVESFSRIARLDAGYARPESVLLARVFPSGLTKERGTVFYRELLSRLNSLPEVEAATIGWNPPFGVGRNTFSLPDREDVVVEAGSSAVAPRFFETHGIPIVAGREFASTQDDLTNGVIVNRLLANKLWPNQDAVGQVVKYGGEVRRVTGVVADDVCEDLLFGPSPCGWRPFPMGTSSGYLRIRTRVDPGRVAPMVERIAYQLHPGVAVAEATTLEAYLADLISKQRFLAAGSLSFALFGVALLAFGSVSLFVSMVRENVREIAIRMALGADARHLTTRIVLQGLLIVVGGALIGMAGSRVLASQLADRLYRTSATESASFVLVPAAVVLIGLVSVLYAAWHAIRTEPSRHLTQVN